MSLRCILYTVKIVTTFKELQPFLDRTRQGPRICTSCACTVSCRSGAPSKVARKSTWHAISAMF